MDKNSEIANDPPEQESCRILKRSETISSEATNASDSHLYQVEYGRNMDHGENDWKESEDESERLVEHTPMQDNSLLVEEEVEDQPSVNESSDVTDDNIGYGSSECLLTSHDRKQSGESNGSIEGQASHGNSVAQYVAIDIEPDYTPPPTTSEVDDRETIQNNPLSLCENSNEEANTSASIATTTTNNGTQDWHEEHMSSISLNSGEISIGTPERDPPSIQNTNYSESYVSKSTQTNFKQGFLKSFKSSPCQTKKPRRNSESILDNISHDDDNGERANSLWTRVFEWIRRRPRQKQSIRERIQGDGRGSNARQLMTSHNAITILQEYINFMYRVFMTITTLDSGIQNSTYMKRGYVVQNVVFWIMAMISICYSIDLLKYYTLGFIDHGLLNDYVNLGFLFIHAATRIYSVSLHAFQNSKITQMAESVNEAYFGAYDHKQVQKTVKSLAMSSFVFAIFASLFGSMPFRDWSPKEIVLTRALEMSNTIFIWSTSNYGNATAQLELDFGIEMTWTTVLLAVPEFLMTFCGYLYDLMLGDFLLASAFSLYQITQRYVETLKSSPATRTTYLDFKIRWMEYQVIARAFDMFYETCGNLLLLYHIYNILQLAIFLKLMLTKSVAQYLFVITFLNVIKSTLTYVVAMKIAEKNQECRNWVRQCALRSLTRRRQRNRRLYMQAILILDEMKDNPLGFGRDELFINKGFLITLFGMAASLFVLLAEYTKEGGKP